MAKNTGSSAFGLYGINSDLEIDPPAVDNLPGLFPYTGPYFPPPFIDGGDQKCGNYTGDVHADFHASVRCHVVPYYNYPGSTKWAAMLDDPDNSLLNDLWKIRGLRLEIERFLEKFYASSAPWSSELNPQEGEIHPQTRYGVREADGTINLDRSLLRSRQGTSTREGHAGPSSVTDSMQGVENTAPHERLGAVPYPARTIPPSMLQGGSSLRTDPYPAPQMDSQTPSPMPPLPAWSPPWEQGPPGSGPGPSGGSGYPFPHQGGRGHAQAGLLPSRGTAHTPGSRGNNTSRGRGGNVPRGGQQ